MEEFLAAVLTRATRLPVEALIVCLIRAFLAMRCPARRWGPRSTRLAWRMAGAWRQRLGPAGRAGGGSM